MTTNTSRRAVLAGAAVLPALALPAIATTRTDPIFAAIDKNRAADKAFIDRCYFEDDLAERGEKLPSAPDDYRTPEMVTVVNASIAARVELANTAPTTLQGLLAYVDAALNDNPGDLLFDGEEEIEIFVRSVYRALQAVA